MQSLCLEIVGEYNYSIWSGKGNQATRPEHQSIPVQQVSCEKNW